MLDQVVSLQAQLASLKAHQAAQVLGNNMNGLAEASISQEAGKAYNRYASYQQDLEGFMSQALGERMNQPSVSNPIMNCESSQDDFISTSMEDESFCGMRSAYNYHDMEDLQSIAYAYLHRS